MEGAQVAVGNGGESRNPGKPFHDECLFLKKMIAKDKTAVQKNIFPITIAYIGNIN